MMSKSQAQALWLAEHTILPYKWTEWLVTRATSKFGRLEDKQYETLILMVSTTHLHWESAVIAQQAWELLCYIKRQEATR